MVQNTTGAGMPSNGTSSTYEAIENDFREICAEVLRRPVGKIRMNKSFLAQGGDSLLAIKLMARCGEAGYNITIHDLLQTTSIKKLCESVMPSEEATAPVPSESPCDNGVLSSSNQRHSSLAIRLSGVQQLYVSGKAWNARLFRIDGEVEESKVLDALKTLVDRHPILRAETSQGAGDNQDGGLLISEGDDTVAFERKELKSGLDNSESELLENVETSLRMEHLPLFAAVVFVQEGTCSARFLQLTAHRALVDATSWVLIGQELYDALATNPSDDKRPNNLFHNWVGVKGGGTFDWGFSASNGATHWEAQEITNDNPDRNELGHGNAIVIAAQEVDAGLSERLQATELHQILRTEPRDLLVAALYLTLREIDPTLNDTLTFNVIVDGRCKDNSGDFAGTVGCFDTVAPVKFRKGAGEDNVQLIRKAKDMRLGYVTKEDKLPSLSGDRGSYITLDTTGFQQGPIVPRTGLHWVQECESFAELPAACLMQVVPYWTNGEFKIRFRVQHGLPAASKTNQISETFRNTLDGLISQLQKSTTQITLSDFPLLDLTYPELDSLVSDHLKRISSDPLEDMEALFPCTPRQEAFLVAQAVYPDMYQCSFIVRIETTTSDTPLDYDRLCAAWAQVVERHPALRTVFIESPNHSGRFDQVVLKQGLSSVRYLDDGDKRTAHELSSRRPIEFKNYQCTHQLTLCEISPYSVYLRLDISHAVVDGQSAYVLLRDLTSIYSDQAMEGPITPYHDFVLYQQQLSEKESLGYWTKYLSGAQPSFFPTKGEQLGRQDLRTVRRHVEFNEAGLEEFCGRFNITPANICQVAWALVLRSYTGSEEICFSYATSGRDIPLKGINNTVGAFLNIVICRVLVQGATPVGQALLQAKTDLVESLAYQYFRATDSDTQAGIMNRLKGNTLMSCQRNAAQEFKGSNLGFELVDAVNPNEYDISVGIFTGPSSLDVMIDFWHSRIPQSTMEAVAESFERAFVSILNDASGTLGAIDVVTPRDISQIREWGGKSPEPADYRIQDRFDEQRLLRPDAWALQGWDGDFTYQQLDEEANKLASHLVTLGVQPETKVPICFEKSKWAIVSQLAILKAGGAVVPLGTNQPLKRTELIVQDLEATIILTTAKLAAKFQGLLQDIIVVDEHFMFSLSPSSAPACAATPDNCAFIIYTSGSTGVPKGVVLPHSSLCTSLHHLGARFNLGHHTRTVQFSAYTFDISIQDIYTTLHYGGCLCVISDDDRIHNLASAMHKYQVNCAGLTSTVAGLIFPQEIPSLTTLVLLGEAVKPAVVEQWINHVDVLNAYGPSECSMQASTNLLTPGCNALNIGFPFAGALWVVDPNDYNRLVPIGAPGELLIEGPIQARGYLNDQVKTAAAFVTDATWMLKNGFGTGHRLYRTGDLVYQNPDGSITYIGRRDTQIKVRGQRVEVGEIEHFLLQHELVVDAAIIFPRQGPCQDRLVGLLTLKDFHSAAGSTTDIVPVLHDRLPLAKGQISTVCHELTSHVPEHMVPNVWIPLETMMPQNDSSKLDRKRLGQWVESLENGLYEALVSSNNDQLQSRDAETSIEREVQNAWADVLRLPLSQIPIEQKSFLGVGGDSISAMRVVSWLRTRGLKLGVREVLESKSIADLARTAQPLGFPESANEPSLLSPAQQWFFESIATEDDRLNSKGDHRYNSSVYLVPREVLDSKSVSRGIRALISRHPMLRSRFQGDSVYGWHQTVAGDGHNSYGFETHVVKSQVEVDNIIAIAQGNLDLEQGPVFSARFIEITSDPEREQILFMTAHILAVDRASWSVLERDLNYILRNQNPLVTRPLPFQSWIKLQAENCRKQIQTPAQLAKPVLPVDIPTGLANYWELADNLQVDEIVEKVTLDSEHRSLLFGKANAALRTEPTEILLAALFKAFKDAFPDRPVPAVFDRYHGRHSIESEMDPSDTVGSFTALTPIHIPRQDPNILLDILKITKDRRRATPGRGLPYFNSSFFTPEGKEAFARHQPIEVLFQLYDGRALLPEDANLFDRRPTVGNIGGIARRPSIFDIDVNIFQGELQIELKYNRHMKHQDKIKELAKLYACSVRELLHELTTTQPTFTLSDFPLLHMNPQSLRNLQDNLLPAAGIFAHEIEDIYPCSPVQQGILMSQVKSPSEYFIQQSFEILPTNPGVTPKIDQLLQAWEVLVNRHPMLRTRFISSSAVAEDRMFDQVVLKTCRAPMEYVCVGEDEVASHLAVKATLNYDDIDKDIGHKITFYSTPSNKTYAKVIVSHALVDAASLMLLQIELARVYDGILAPNTPGPSYGAYISYLQQTPVDEAVQYWTNRLADAEPCYLPTLTVIQPTTTDPSASPQRLALQSVSLDIDFTDHINRFSKSSGVTPANLFQLSWALVLAQYTGSNDVSFGYLSSGRDVPVNGAHEMVGPLINMLVSHINMIPELSVQETLQRVQDNLFESFNYQRAPLIQIWHALQLQGRSLFNTALSYRPVVSSAKEKLGLDLRQVAGEDPTEYDATVNVFASQNRTSISLQYSPKFLSGESALRLLRCMKKGLRSLISNKDSPLSSIDILPQEDVTQVCKWNAEIAKVDSQSCIHEVVTSQRLLRPGAPAVCAWDGDLTYQELDTMADNLAYHLGTQLGVGPEVMVALCLDKSKWAIIAQLAVLKAGGCVVSVNPKHPTQRLEAILRDINAHVVLTTERYSSLFTTVTPQILHMDAALFAELPAATGAPPQRATLDNAAFIIYTSGSTGMPKGVILTHLALWSSFQAHGKVYRMTPNTRSLQFASYTFDASISDIWATITHGGCVCVISEEERMNNLQQVLESYHATHAQLTPTVAGLLDIPSIGSLNTLVLGGEAVKEAMVEEYAKAAGRVRVLNGYGPSECSIYTTCGAPLVEKVQAPNIGRPLVGSVWVVANERICPIGAVGELWIQGPLLARGYLNDQNKTDAAFVPNPLWAKSVGLEGHRFYRTGDLVRQALNGDIIYQARKDSQVKIRGQRVEVGEIEYRVKKLLPVAKSLVATLINPGGNPASLVVAVAMELAKEFVGPNPSFNSAQEILFQSTPQLREAFGQLHTYLADALPSYMLPRLFIPVAELPQTTSGKLDRRSLRQLLESLPEETLFQYSLSDSSNVSPATELEKKLQSLWAAVLNIDTCRVGVQDHFLHVGGDSFTAMRLVSQANSSGIPLTVADVFRYPKLQDMALYIEKQSSLGQEAEEVPRFSLWKEASGSADQTAVELKRLSGLCNISPDRIEDVYPSTPLQEGLMAITAQKPRAYVGRWVFRLSGTTDIELFKISWDRLAQEVPIIRTRIIPGKYSGALQVVVQERLSWLHGQDLQTYIRKDEQKSFTYGQPLMRFSIIMTDEPERYFVLTAHHSVYDGASLGKILDAVTLLYEGNDLPPVPSFTRFIRYLETQDTTASQQFWKSQLEGDTGAPFPSLPRPTYRPQPSKKMGTCIEVPLVDGMTTMASVLRGAWALAVSPYSGNDVVFGVALSGRAAPVPGVLEMLAPTITTVPVRVQIDFNQPVPEFLAAVHQQTVDMMPFEHTGLHHIRRLLGVNLELPHLFAVQPAQEQERIADGKIWSYQPGLAPEFDLDGYALTVECFTGSSGGSTIQVEAHFDENVIPFPQMTNLLHRFRHISTQLLQIHTTRLDGNAKRLGELDLLSPEEVTQLMSFNRDVPKRKHALVHDLVYKQVRIFPSAPAVCSWDGELTYAELDILAEKLAHHLITLGVQVEDMVALCLDKSKWAVVANMAVLKAGAAVVPVRSEPIQRVQTILQDTGIRIVLTTPSYSPLFEQMASHVLSVDDALLSAVPSASARVNSAVSPGNKAFVIYTSGSTGTPKGVVIEHGAMSTSMQAHGTRFGMNSQTRAFNFAHFTFDISLHDIITPLQFGGCVCLPSEQQRVNDMAGAMRKLEVNYSFLPPRVIHTIQPSDIPNLRTLVVGGEAVQAEHLEPWLNGVRVFNAYGPAECCIASTYNEVVDRADTPNIGTALAGGLWVVNEQDYNRLVPLGAVGELLLEGPLLARGYLNDPVKTSKAFITDPAWVFQLPGIPGTEGKRRMYRTGDLVRQADNGSLTYVGRSDGQVKIRGQRVEIGEIEHHLTNHPAVVEAVALYPRAGAANSQLVGILTLCGFTSSETTGEIQPTGSEQLAGALSQASIVHQHLTGCVPEYMVPSIWISLASMPHNTSDKIDRRTLTQWLEAMSQDSFEHITRAGSSGSHTTPGTVIEKNIQGVWGQVLNLTVERIPVNLPFLRVGGDSITAMQVVSQCRAHYGISVTVQDVLQSDSITQLAQKAKVKTTGQDQTKTSNSAFGLSPAQAFYFESISPNGLQVNNESYYNQSICLIAQRRLSVQDVNDALERLMSKHLSLRLRYRETENGFVQQIAPEVKGSFGLRVHDVQTIEEARDVAVKAQQSLDLINGPVFSAQIISVSSDERQIIYLIAHRLIVDILSWSILVDDLELSIANHGYLAPSKDMSFEQWTRLQTGRIQERTTVGELLPIETPIQDWSYWGLTAKDNIYSSRVTEHLTLDANIASLLLREDQPLGTYPYEPLLAALFLSFGKAFPDRAAPTIFHENNCRDTGMDTVDLSGTVGWFNTLTPIYVCANTDDPMDVLRQTKDNRRRVARTSMDYFSSRYLTKAGQEKFGPHRHSEVIFSYSGPSKRVQYDTDVFRLDESLNIPSIGADVRRPAVFEIEAHVVDNALLIDFSFSGKMHKQDAARCWIDTYQRSLTDLVNRISNMHPTYTLSDFPSLDLTYEDIDKLQREVLPRVGIENPRDLEDIYSCSPIQQGILLSQIKDKSTYQVQQSGKIKGLGNTTHVDPDCLVHAWQAVVKRHAILRTIFIPSPSGKELFYQVVLRHYVPTTTVIPCESADIFLSSFSRTAPPTYNDGQPPYQLALYPTTTGEICARLDISHALMDASSMDLLFNEIISSYDNALSITPAPSYGTYVSFLQQTSANESLDYWTNRLAMAQPCHFPSSPSPDSAVRVMKSVSAEITDLQSMLKFRDSHSVTIANIVQLAWGVVLAAYIGTNDVIFGYLANGRDAPIDGIHEMAGPMINMMVTRIQLKDNLQPGEAARGVQGDFLEAFNHQRTSLGDIQHALHLREQSLFNTTMVYKRKPISAPTNDMSITIESLNGEDPTEYNVQLKVLVDDHRIMLALEYASTVLNEYSARRLLGSLESSLASITKSGTANLGEVDVLPPSDLTQLHEWNSNVPEVIDARVHDKIQQRAISEPNSQAVCSWDGELTFAELNRLTHKLAVYLRSLGVCEEVKVGLCFDKSMWTVVSMLAVLKCGGVVVPLGVQLPSQRLRLILEDTEAPVVLTMDQHVSKFDQIAVQHLITVDASFFDTQAEPTGPLNSPSLNLNSAAVVIYTSGSTGRPKGVILTHGSLCTSIESHGAKLGLGPHTRTLQYSAYVFDISLLDIFSTLQFGGCVCVVSEDDRVNVDNLAMTMEAMKANFAVLTPTVASIINPRAVPTLATLVLAGEAVQPDVVEPWLDHVTVFNGYGPAECTILASSNGPITEKEDASNIGFPLSGALWVVDPEDYNRLVPLGVEGELLISGPLLAREYLNDPKRTTQSFVSDPTFVSRYGFQTWVGHRMYRTGDLVRQDPADGSVTYIGRADGQVKVRGQRVEVGEIEHWVKRHFPQAQAVAADLINSVSESGDISLVATVELGKHSEDHTSPFIPVTDSLRKAFFELQESLTQELPSYMVPSKYIPIHQMPMTASGKLDRRSLRSMLETLSEEQLSQYGLSEANRVAPSTSTEHQLVALWTEALKATRIVSANTHFFRAGGDSVTAMRLVALARATQPPIPLEVGDIFKRPVLSDMAAAIDKAISAGLSVTLPESHPFSLWATPLEDQESRLAHIALQCNIASNTIQDIYPCSPLQEGLMSITAQHSQAYIGRWVFRIDSGIDSNQLRSAWQRVCDQVPILRTRIIQESTFGMLQVVVTEQLNWKVISSDLDTYIAQDAAKPIGFGEPLMRFAVVTNSTERFFVWTAHHSAYDGWTSQKLLDVVSDAYRSQREPDCLPFAPFVRYLQESSTEETQEYWGAQLKGGMGPSFPEVLRNYKPGPLQDHQHRITVQETSDEFTISTLLRASWALILSQETESQTVSFATALSGRTAPVAGILDIMGPTITTVPVRILLDRSQSMIDYLSMVQQQAVDMLPFEHTGLQNIQQIASDAKFAFQHLFVVQPSLDRSSHSQSTFPGLEPVPLEAAQFYSYPLVVECNIGIQDDTSFIDLSVHFDPVLLPKGRIQILAERFERVFLQLQRAASGHTEINKLRIEDVNFMTASDISQIQAWNPFTENMTRENACIHDLFSQQLLSSPDAPAVCAWDGKLSYRELDDVSSRLACHLASLGVGPEKTVAAIFEKTQWVVVTYLAVLKAGGTIVPIHHQHPVQRVRYIVDSAATEIILTSQDPQHLNGVAPHIIKVGPEFIAQLPQMDSWSCTDVRPTNSAFIIFTSGSTGVPKGVVLEHGSLASSMKSHGSLYASSETRVLQFCSFNFDVSISEIFTTLIFGGCVVVVSEEDRASRLGEAMEEFGVNFAMITPTIANLLKPEQVPSLKGLVMLGEALRPEVALPWISSHVGLYNAYGPAECSILTTWSRRITEPNQAPNIGHALAHSNLWVVDPSNYHQLLPVGMVGELLVEGPLVARGYLGDDNKTAASFVTDPVWPQQFELGPQSGRRFYCTGDLVQQQADGSLVYLGRKDTQVKINGQRVETGEIEFSVKSMLPTVQEVAVGLFQPADGDHQPALAVVMEVSGSSDSTVETPHTLLSISDELRDSFMALRRELLDALPAYMVPQLYIPASKLPLTDSGKLNRRATWEIVQECSSWSQYLLVDEVKVAPSTETEHQLQSLWAMALKVPIASVGAKDDFFRSGGDSISAMRLVANARDRAQVALKVADVFRYPTLSDMASFIDQTRGKLDATPTKYQPFSSLDLLGHSVRISLHSLLSVPGNIVDAAPVTDFQALALTLSLRHSRDLMAYLYIDGTGSPDIPRWSATCLQVVKQHEILRTAYVCHDRQILQVVLQDYEPGINVYETEKTIDEFSKELTAQDMYRPPQMGQPFLEFAIITSKSESRHRILLRLSHADYDAISLSYLTNSFHEIYQKQPVTDYPSFCRYMSSLPSYQTESSREYWRDLLAGSSMPVIAPKQRTRRLLPTQQTYHRAQRVHIQKVLPVGITVSTIVRAAWAHVLAQHIGRKDVLFGEVVSGRNTGDPIAENVGGCCVNPVPVRLSFDESWTVLELLRSVQNQLVSRLPHENLGYREILRSRTDMLQGTLFSSMLNHLDRASEWTLDLEDGQYQVSVVKSEGAGDVSDISITSTSGGDYVEIAMAYLEDGISAELAEELFSRVCETADLFVNGSMDTKLAMLPTSENAVEQFEVEGSAPVFDGDLVDAAIVAFTLQQRGVEATVDDVIEQGLNVDV